MPSPSVINAIWARATDDVWAVGMSPTVLLHFDGQSWAPVRSHAAGAIGLFGISGGAGPIVIVGTGGFLDLLDRFEP